MALPPPQTQIPMWEALRQQDAARKAKMAQQRKAEMIQNAQAAGIPYSPEYLALQGMEMPDEVFYNQPPQAPAPAPAPALAPAPAPAISQQPPSSVAATGAPPSPNPSSPQSMGPPESLAGGGGAPTSIWEELGPEGIRAILEGQAVEEQKQYADALRRTPGAEGRTVRNGIYVGASPLEHLAVGYRRYKGKKGVKEAQGKQQKIRESIIDIIRGKVEEEQPELPPTSMRDLL